jgi:hypothetical protein
MSDRIKFYGQRAGTLREQKLLIDRRLRHISRSRGILFLLMIGSIALAMMYTNLFLLITLALLIAFGYQVKRFAVESNEAAIATALLQLNENELNFARGDKSVFPHGEAGEGQGHIYAVDLDIFGKGSLFQAIDRSGTYEGRGLVADALLNLPKDISVIEQRKAATIDLADDMEWRQRFHVVGTMAGETPSDMPSLRKWVDQYEFFETRRSWIWIARGISALSVAFIAWMFIVQEFYFLYFMGWLIFNSAVRGLLDKDIRRYFNTFGSRTKLFQKFADLFQLVSKREFKSPLGQEHHRKVDEASSAFLELSQLSNRADQRLNAFVGLTMNGLFLFDIWNIHAIERWRLKHKARVDDWIIALANIDMLSSLANYRFNHPAFTDAILTTGPAFMKAKALGHPLLPFETSVKNDYEIGLTTQAHIVTGSNMAGKSTFIRTVGLNLVLAMNGLPVCAQECSCTVVSIASCIRITDSLEEHASYFRAELIRLEQIVSLLGNGQPYIVLLDEILRGTNSDDKRMGTLAFFRKLKDHKCLAILATHDLVIGKLEAEFPQHFSNYCFESELRGSQLYFDYKLRRGVSSSTNATFLMKSLGLID